MHILSGCSLLNIINETEMEINKYILLNIAYRS